MATRDKCLRHCWSRTIRCGDHKVQALGAQRLLRQVSLIGTIPRGFKVMLGKQVFKVVLGPGWSDQSSVFAVESLLTFMVILIQLNWVDSTLYNIVLILDHQCCTLSKNI